MSEHAGQSVEQLLAIPSTAQTGHSFARDICISVVVGQFLERWNVASSKESNARQPRVVIAKDALLEHIRVARVVEETAQVGETRCVDTHADRVLAITVHIHKAAHFLVVVPYA